VEGDWSSANGIIIKNSSATNSSRPAEIYFDRTALSSGQKASVGIDYSSRNFFIWVNGNDRLNINTYGDVGIGTTLPDTKLHVNGAITLGAAGGPQIKTGAGTPSGADGAPIGSLYLNTNGGANTTLYVKTGATTWTPK
jgi:hypothetical protein